VKDQFIRQKVIIDTEVVNSRYAHGNNSTKYCTFGKNDDVKDDNLTKGWCFSDLLKMLTNKEHNKIYYKMEEDGKQSVKLTKTEKHKWVELCVKHKTMPEYITKDDIDKKIMTIDVEDENITPSLIFIYLCCFRYFREDPGFIRAVVYLVKKCKMNYYAAFVFASRACLNYDLHHILSIVRRYSEKFDVYKITVPLNVIIGLSRIVNGPKKYDKRGPRDYKSGGGFNQFRCADNIHSISKTKYDCSLQDLFDKNILKAIISSSDETSKKYLDKFLSYKDKIVYKEEIANE